MKLECVNCLCSYCVYNRTPTCRYCKKRTFNACNARCYHIDNTVIHHFNPVLICDKFVHRSRHKRYKIKLVRSARCNALASISLKDFLKLLGGDNK